MRSQSHQSLHDMQISETEPFPAFTDEQPEPFPNYDNEFADFLAHQLKQIDPYDQPFLSRPSPSPSPLSVAKQPAPIPRPPYTNQRHIFESFPSFQPDPGLTLHCVELSSSGNERTDCFLPVSLMAQPTLPCLDATFGLVDMKYNGGPHANFWKTSRTYKVRVNDQTVVGSELMIGDGGGATTAGDSGKIKRQISRIASALHRKQQKSAIKTEQNDVKHDPRHGQPEPFVTKADLDALHRSTPTVTQIPERNSSNGSHSRSFSIASITRTLSKRLGQPDRDYREQMLGLVAQPVPVPDCNGILPHDRVSSINHWIATLASDTLDDERQDNFVALTTAELIGIGGADIDGIEIVKKYYAPTNSPVPEAVRTKQVAYVFEEDEQKPRRKDLIEYLGTQRNSGFHLISMMNVSGSTYEDPMNLSDYYEIPLIEPEKAFQLNSRSHDSSISSSLSSTSTYAMLKDPRRYLPPAHSLILYLHGRGFSTARIIQTIGELDRTWVFEHQNRWYGNLRVPDLQEFTDEVVEKIRDEYRRKREYWEIDGARDEKGTLYPLSWKVVMWRQRQMDVRRLVERVVEKHLAFKLKGMAKNVVPEAEGDFTV